MLDSPSPSRTPLPSAPDPGAGPRVVRVAALATGLVGSLVVALGTLFIGRFARTPGATLVLEMHHRHEYRTALLLMLGGLSLMSLAWLVLGWSAWRGESSSRHVLRATAVWAVPLAVAPPAFSGDVWSYVADGMVMAHGWSPYVVSPAALSGPVVHAVAPTWLHTVAPYGPLPLLWGDLVAHLSASPWLGVYAFRLLALAALALLAWGVRALARECGVDPSRALWLVVASPFTLVHGVSSAHVDLLLAALLTLGVLAAVRRRLLLALLLVGLATAVKVPAVLGAVPLAAAALPVARARTRVLLTGALAVAALAVVAVIGVLGGVGLGWVAALRTPLIVNTPLSLTVQLGKLAQGEWGASAIHHAQTLGEVVLVLLVGALVLRGPRPPRTAAGVVALGAAVTSAAVVLSPVGHFWYAFWCLPLVACTPLSTRWRRVVVAVVGVMGPMAVFDPPLGMPHYRSVLVVATLLAAAVAAVLPDQLVTSLTPKRAQAASQNTAT